MIDTQVGGAEDLEYAEHMARLADNFRLVTSSPGEGEPPRQGGLTVTPTPARVEAGRDFALTLRFSHDARPRFVELALELPDGEQASRVFAISKAEAGAGEKTIPGFRAGSWGEMRVSASLFTDDGVALSDHIRFAVVPQNPFQISIYPRYSGKSWRGAVQYSFANGRYYCHVRCVFANGNPFPVVVHPSVHVEVTDGSRVVTEFSFDMAEEVVVHANTTQTRYFYTYYEDSGVATIFANFGDVRITHTFGSSDGVKSDSAVWVMMGQIKVACNFVGDFSSAEKTAARNLVLGKASSIYEQVDLCLTSAPILWIPVINPDWGRYRDIEIDSCKHGSPSSAEGDDLRINWSSPDDYPKHIDLWFVESFSGEACAASLGGFSPQSGPASKDGKDSGVVIDVKDLDILNSSWDAKVFGVVVAHELGHYLGLEHVEDDPSNFMSLTIGSSNTDITWDQHNIADNHDWVQKLNP